MEFLLLLTHTPIGNYDLMQSKDITAGVLVTDRDIGIRYEILGSTPLKVCNSGVIWILHPVYEEIGDIYRTEDEIITGFTSVVTPTDSKSLIQKKDLVPLVTEVTNNQTGIKYRIDGTSYIEGVEHWKLFPLDMHNLVEYKTLDELNSQFSVISSERPVCSHERLHNNHLSPGEYTCSACGLHGNVSFR